MPHMASTVQCHKCKKAVPGNAVRFISSNVFVCEECYAGHQGKPRKEAVQSVSSIRNESSARKYDVSPSRHVEYSCTKCGFVTRVREDIPASKCGYCGGATLRPKENSAAQLLAEADDDFSNE